MKNKDDITDLQPWIEEAHQVEYDCGWFSVHRHDRRSQVSQVKHDFYLIETSNWVNVVPVLADGRVLFVRQYRQSAEIFSLEVPAGIVEPDEDPLEAGRRELLEETGFGDGDWTALGSFFSNPALIRNRVLPFLALNVVQKGKMQPDAEEELELIALSRTEIEDAIRKGLIHNAITIAVLHKAFLHSPGSQS